MLHLYVRHAEGFSQHLHWQNIMHLSRMGILACDREQVLNHIGSYRHCGVQLMRDAYIMDNFRLDTGIIPSGSVLGSRHNMEASASMVP